MVELWNVRRLRAAVALCFALAIAPVVPWTTGTASAKLSVCRTDPVIYLSNGTMIQIVASIGDSLSDVKQITYVVHGPSGTRVKAIGYSGGGLLEKVTYLADQGSHTFVTDALVTTGASAVSVSVAVSVPGMTGRSAAGSSGRHILVIVS